MATSGEEVQNNLRVARSCGPADGGRSIFEYQVRRGRYDKKSSQRLLESPDRPSWTRHLSYPLIFRCGQFAILSTYFD